MKNIKGFSFIEVLVAVAVLSTALLGLVGLQAAGMKNVVSSYNRTQASQLASGMADRMRANVADITAAATGGTSRYITLGATETRMATAVVKANCSNTTGCSAAEMAENDLYEWNLALKDSSNGLAKTGTITVADFNPCPQSAPPPFQLTVTVSWSEGRNDNKNDDNDDNVIDYRDIDSDLSFQTIFQIPRYPC